MSAVGELLQPGGAIARRLPDYEQRPEQLQLAEAVERALQQNRHLLAEAGTGVGKSFAYLLPAVLHADRHQGEGPIVISTRTIALQQQLERKDLPFLHAVLPIEWSSVTALGRGNHLCLRRLDMARRDGGLYADAQQHADLQRLADWSTTTPDGLRFELTEQVADLVWEEVNAEQGNCLNKACRHYDRCHWQRARRRMQTAQILVVNHSLYFADLALRMAGVQYLPPHRAVIFDEAHHLERVATESLGLALRSGTVPWHLMRLQPGKRRRSLLRDHCGPRAQNLWHELRTCNDEFFGRLDAMLNAKGASEGVDLGDQDLEQQLSALLRGLADEVAVAAAGIEEVDHRTELQARGRTLAIQASVIDRLCQRDADGKLVRWLERGAKGPELRAAPLSVADTLREHLFGQRTAVLVSATLGTGTEPDYRWLRGQLGVTAAFDCLRLGSPFDYRRAVRLQLEEAMPDPARDGERYDREAIARTVAHVRQNRGCALVLCTSRRFVQAVAAALRDPLEDLGVPLLVQGEAPLGHLLEEKRRVPASVLVGTDSLWEGIDLRGDALTLVVLTRLPFAMPNHPLTRARSRAIEQRGGDPFAEQSLPEAILKFRQGFGRLIRSQQDRGKVVILDPRARTRWFGRAFLAALPVEAEEPDAWRDPPEAAE